MNKEHKVRFHNQNHSDPFLSQYFLHEKNIIFVPRGRLAHMQSQLGKPSWLLAFLLALPDCSNTIQLCQRDRPMLSVGEGSDSTRCSCPKAEGEEPSCQMVPKGHRLLGIHWASGTDFLLLLGTNLFRCKLRHLLLRFLPCFSLGPLLSGVKGWSKGTAGGSPKGRSKQNRNYHLGSRWQEFSHLQNVRCRQSPVESPGG